MTETMPSTSWADESEDLELDSKPQSGNAWKSRPPMGAPLASSHQERPVFDASDFPEVGDAKARPEGREKPSQHPSHQKQDIRRDPQFSAKIDQFPRQEGYRNRDQQQPYPRGPDRDRDRYEEERSRRTDFQEHRGPRSFEFREERRERHPKYEGFRSSRDDMRDIDFERGKRNDAFERKREENLYREESFGQRRRPRSDMPREPLPMPTEPPFTAYVGNLPFDVTEQEIQNFFADRCTVTSVRLLFFKPSGRPKGSGYVEFSDLESLQHALSRNGEMISERPLRIDIAEAPKGNGFRGDSGGSWRGPKSPQQHEAPEGETAGEPKERPKLALQPRSVPVVQENLHSLNPVYKESQANPFGEAKPRDEDAVVKKKEDEKKVEPKPQEKVPHQNRKEGEGVKPVRSEPRKEGRSDKPFKRGERTFTKPRREDKRQGEKPLRNGSAEKHEKHEERPRREPKPAILQEKKLNVVSHNVFSALGEAEE